MHPDIPIQKTWKYAQQERERRFLLNSRPLSLIHDTSREIEDKYLQGGFLRLRKVQRIEGITYKLTKKIPLDLDSRSSHWISTLYLSETEYALFNSLSGVILRKKRYYLSQGRMKIAIDELCLKEGPLWLADVEFEEEEEMSSYVFPLPFKKEVTEDPNFSGYELALRQIHSQN